MRTVSNKAWLIAVAGLILGGLLIWLVRTDNGTIWPIRHTLQYRILNWWWEYTGEPALVAPGTLQGVVRDSQGQPIAGAWVLVARWDGTTYSTRSEADGHYGLDVPAGRYRPVAGAPGYGDVVLGSSWNRITIKTDTETVVDVVLPDEPPPTVTPGTQLALGEPASQTCPRPIEATAMRRQITFDSNGRPSQPAFFYTPITATAASRLPGLLVIYPGPVAEWECASLPLAAAGYALVAAGPAYSLELETDIDELERLVGFIRAGSFPGSDPTKLAVLGGSYSGLHVQRLLQRNPNVEAAVLLGPPTDLFDMRRRLENGTFIPPYDLDQALIALGFPDREPLRYWRYSGAYHIRPDLSPLVIMHSRTDNLVPFQQSELLSANLTEAGVPHETYFFDEASHYLITADGEGDADTLEIYRITLDFLAQHLR